MRRRLFIFILAAFAVLTGCERRPLEYGNATLNLRLNLRLNVKVNGELQELPEPEMMRVMFFDPETFDLVTESYLPAGGGRVSLAPGRYKFIAYNFDTEATLLRNDRNYYSIEAYTNEVSQALKNSTINAIRYAMNGGTKADSDEEASTWERALMQIQENPVIYEPDHLFTSHQDIEVLNIDGDQVIEADAETIIETWKISVKIKNEQYMASARALLTGQIASNFIGLPKDEGKTDTDVTLMFDMKADAFTNADSEDGTSDMIVGQFNTFGKNPNVYSRLWLTIIIKTVGGDTIEWHRDITDEFFTEEAYEDQTIHIEDDTIVITPPNPSGGSGNGGFQPGVDDWEEENIPINI